MLQFDRLIVCNWRSFYGEHEILLARKPGLYFVSGINKAEPVLEHNGAGKSSLFVDALLWVLTGNTMRSRVPGAKVEARGSKGPMFVELHFRVRDEPHELVRARRPQQKLTLDGKTVDQEQVDKLIGLSERTIPRTIMVGQFQKLYPLFLDLPAEQQTSLFTEILDLDFWLKASARANRAADGHEKELGRLDIDIRTAHAKREEVSDQYEKACDDHDHFEDSMEEAIAKERAEIARLKAELAVEHAPPVEDSRLATPEELEAIEDAIDDLRAKIKADEVGIQKLVDAVALVRNDRTNAERQENRYRHASKSKVCPECGQDIKPGHIEAKINAALTASKKADQAASLAEHELKVAREKVAVVNARIEEKVRALREARARIDTEASLRRQQDDERANTERDIESSERLIREYKSRPNPYGDRAKELKQRRTTLDNEITDLEAQRRDAEQDLADANFWVRGFKEIRLNEIDEALQELEIATNDHADALGLRGWSIEFKTERVTATGTTSSKFSTFLYPKDEKEPIAWETYSGGEVQRWQLAVILGQSQVLLAHAGITPNISIWDEPTQHLSPRGVDDLLSYLRQKAEDDHRAIYFIDQNVYDSGIFDGIISIVKDADGSHIEERT